MISGNSKLSTSRLSQLIKELRGNLSQREFAKLLGTSYTTIQDWEKQIRLPSPKNLQRLSQLKGCTQAELINYLFPIDDQAEVRDVDRVQQIVFSFQDLSWEQMQTLNQHLQSRINSQTDQQQDSQW